MSEESAEGLVFFDTDVLVYAHDASEPRKRDIVREWILGALGADTLRTSTQALSEYFSVVTVKGEHRMSAASARWLLDQLSTEAVVTPGLDAVQAAAARCVGGGLSIWDALIVEAARACGAAVLLSEDARLRAAVDARADRIRVVDPFLAA